MTGTCQILTTLPIYRIGEDECRDRMIKRPRIEAAPNSGLASVALLRTSSRGQGLVLLC